MYKATSPLTRNSLPMLLMGVVMLASVAFSGSGEHKVSLEDKTKAVFMYHFTKYIQWPDSDSADVFTIGVIGNAGIIVPLQEIEKKKKVKNRSIVVKQIDSLPDIRNCHMLFVSQNQSRRFPAILKTLKDAPILTIGDTKGFAHKGLAINFILVKGKIKFEINSEALDATNLKVSSQLLKLGKFIEEGK